MDDRSRDVARYAEYVKQHLGEPLSCAIAEIVEIRPRDPVEYLAHWLYRSKGMNPAEASLIKGTNSEREGNRVHLARNTQRTNTSSSVNDAQRKSDKDLRLSSKLKIDPVGAEIMDDNEDDFIDEDITNISTRNFAMAHVHVDFNKITEDLFDHDDLS